MISTRSAPMWLRGLAFAGAALAAFGLAFITPGGGAVGRPTALPEFKHTSPSAWINSPPLTKAGLKGKVVLLEVYTSS